LLAEHGDFFIGSVLVVAWLAAFSGDNLGYPMGRYGGHCLVRKMGVSAQRLARLHHLIREVKQPLGMLIIAVIIGTVGYLLYEALGLCADAKAQRAVGEGVRSCPRARCWKSACRVR
jgi:hypothetical protein